MVYGSISSTVQIRHQRPLPTDAHRDPKVDSYEISYQYFKVKGIMKGENDYNVSRYETSIIIIKK